MEMQKIYALVEITETDKSNLIVTLSLGEVWEVFKVFSEQLDEGNNYIFEVWGGEQMLEEYNPESFQILMINAANDLMK